MAYTKNHASWTAGDALTTAIMDNFETQYTEASSYLSSHTHTASYYTKTEMNSTFWYAGNDGSGSGSDADLIYKSTGNLHAASFSGLGIPTGLIIMWSGGAAPSGWHLCDGTGGTVNLLDRFIVGAGTGSAYTPGNTGGSATFTVAGTITVDNHVLSVEEMGAHRHPFQDKYGNLSSTGNVSTRSYGSTTTSTGTTAAAGSGQGHGHSSGEGTAFTGNAVACMPYYYALAFIQKT